MALLNQNHLKSLVAVGIHNSDGTFTCQASSFLIGFIFKDHSDPLQKLYRTFLVTNRHVFDQKKKTHLRFNSKDGKVKIFPLDLFDKDNEPI